MDVATDPFFSIVSYIWVKKIIENGFWDMSVSLKSGGIWMAPERGLTLSSEGLVMEFWILKKHIHKL